MKTFNELCQGYLGFKKVLEKKCKDYCTIHQCENPFNEEITDIEIDTEYDKRILICYKTYQCGGYSSEELRIPMSFFETDDYSEVEAAILEKKNKIDQTQKEKRVLEEQYSKIKSKREQLKKDMDDINRISKEYGIERNENFEKPYREYQDLHLPESELYESIKKLDILLNELRK